jgi:hypothetical protein
MRTFTCYMILGLLGCSEWGKSIMLSCGFKITEIIVQPAEENAEAAAFEPGTTVRKSQSPSQLYWQSRKG